MDSLLKNDKLYYIGGIVRDEILGLKSRDIDITYVGNAIDYCKSLAQAGIGEIKQVNTAFATVRMIINNQEIDFASTRNEYYPKKGHLPHVYDIGCELKKDVLRRDFTINAMAKSLKTGEIIDYTGGLEDLKAQKLRVLHDDSFIDDPTRIIRGLKFSVRFGFSLDEHTQELERNYLSNVNYDMSYKRLKKELTETFNLNSQKAYEEFIKRKMYKLISDEDITAPDYNIEALIKKFPVNNIWLVYLGWLNLSRIPLSKEEQKIIDDYNSLKNTEIQADKFSIYKAFENKMTESILLYTIVTNSNKGLEYLNMGNIKLQICGKDLMNLNIPPSSKYRECFDYVLKQKLDNPEISYDTELEIAKEFFSR